MSEWSLTKTKGEWRPWSELGALDPTISFPADRFVDQLLRVPAQVALEARRWTRLFGLVARHVVRAATCGDARVLGTLQPGPAAMKVLRDTEDVSLNYLGCFRPDVLFPDVRDNETSWTVCEVNARYVANGFFVTHGARRVSVQQAKDDDVFSVTGVPEAFAARLRDDDGPVAIVRSDRVTLWDMPILIRHLEAEGRMVRHVTNPGSELRVVESGDLVFASDGATVGSAVLEVPQTELEALPHAMLVAFVRLAGRGRCLNDLRTVLLLHNKALLALLCDQEVSLAAGLTDDEASFLRAHVVPTHVVTADDDSDRDDDDFRGARDEWVLKPGTLGKGEGVVIGARCETDVAWHAAVDAAAADTHAGRVWVRQPYVEQRRVRVRGELCMVVGTFLVIDGHFHGFGMLRAGAQDIVSVTRGGSILLAEPVSASEAVVPRHVREYGEQRYWNERYEVDRGTFEWFFGWARIGPFLCQCACVGPTSHPTVLHVGCGNSTLGVDMCAATGGWDVDKVVNLDYSTTCIDTMRHRFPNHRWVVGDARQLGENVAPSGSFDCVVDKGTLDALLVDSGDKWTVEDMDEAVVREVDRYLGEMDRVLRPNGGIFAHLTWSPRWFRQQLLERVVGWSVEAFKVPHDEETRGIMEYWLYVARKRCACHHRIRHDDDSPP